MINNHPYKDRKYDYLPYDPQWPFLFNEYAKKIDKIFEGARMEHIGSTSIPGMNGKSCIDILVIVQDLHEVEKHVDDMEAAGFEYAGQFLMQDSRLFREIKDNKSLANIHFFADGHPHISEMIVLRNYLRSHPEEVKAYSMLKETLYSKYKNNYASYRKHKDEYMEELKIRAAQDISNK